MPRREHRFADPRRLPSSLRSRSGWCDYLEVKRPEEPHLHQIEPTNHCPYTCIMCPRHKMTRRLGFLDLGLYRKVIDEVADCSQETKAKEIELFHFGESILHPGLDAMVGHAFSKGLKVVLSVNAPQLGPKWLERILAAGPHRIILSLDGYDRDSYRKIRGDAADFDKGMRNIESLMTVHRRLGASTELTVRMIELRANDGHRERFRETFEAMGLNVEFRPFFPWTEPDMDDLGEYDAYPAFMPCPFPWEYLVVQWDGSVVPCCRDYDAVNVVGNVAEESLYEIWNGKRFQAFRDQHRSGDYAENRLCQDCMSLYYTEPPT